MLDKFATFSGTTVTTYGTPPVLWPDIGFPATGPTAAFLASVGAVRVRQDCPCTRYQKRVPAAPYVAAPDVFDMSAVALANGEKTAQLAAYKVQKKAEVKAAAEAHVLASYNLFDLISHVWLGFNAVATRAGTQTGDLPVVLTAAQQTTFNTSKGIADWVKAVNDAAKAAIVSINAVTTGSATYLDDIDAIVAAIVWPPAP